MRYLAFILAVYTSAAAAEPAIWPGPWASTHGRDGSALTIKNVTTTSFDFAVSATSGANVGELEGRAHIDGSTASFSLTGDAGEKPCTGIFTLTQKPPPTKLQLVTDHCDSYGGAGVSFDDQYQIQTSATAKGPFTAGFDCTKATSSVERAICSDQDLAQADHELVVLFTRARSTVKGAKHDALVKTQKQWLARRDTACRATPTLNCLAPLYEKRLRELGAAVNGGPIGGVTDRVVLARQLEHQEIARLSEDDALRLYLKRHLGSDEFEGLLANLTASSTDAHDLALACSKDGCIESGCLKGLCAESRAFIVVDQGGGLWVGMTTITEQKKRALKLFKPHRTGAKLPALVQSAIDAASNGDKLPVATSEAF